jgi:hypothetical protein
MRSNTATLLVLVLCAAGVAYPQQPAPKYTLSFETGLVLKSGDVKPVARVDFYLLNRDPGNIAKITFERNVQQLIAKVTGDPVPAFPGFFCKPGDTKLEYQGTCDIFRKNRVATTVTDFGGKGKFTVPPGTYYLFGYATIGINQVVWNVKVTLTRDESIVLDNRNAASIETIEQ